MIDYKLLSGRGSGPSISFAPGYKKPAPDHFVNLDEEVFFIIESFLSKFGLQVDHYEVSTVAASEWSKTMDEILKEVENRSIQIQRDGFDINQVKMWPWLAPHRHIVLDIESRGPQALTELLEMLREVAVLGKRWATTFPLIHIVGV